MADVVRCGNCLAALRLDVGAIVSCTYCGAETRLDVAEIVAKPVSSGARLAEAVAFVTPTRSNPFLETSRDDQEALALRVSDHQAGPSRLPKISLTVRVSASGEMSLTLIEPDTDNALDRAGLTARVVA